MAGIRTSIYFISSRQILANDMGRQVGTHSRLLKVLSIEISVSLSMVFGLFVVQKMPTNVFDFLWKTNLFVNIDAQKQTQINKFFV